MTQTLIEKLEALKSEAITVHGEYNSGIDRAISIARQNTDDQARELERLEKLVYVPGLWKCAKCGCKLISNTIYMQSGTVGANNSPQQCPNNCGPMWRVTERDAGNDVCDRSEKLARELAEARKLNAELVAAMMPFVRFVEFQRLKEKLDSCEPKPETGIASVMDGEDGVHLVWKDLLAVKEAFDKSQPHRPEPATPAGKL